MMGNKKTPSNRVLYLAVAIAVSFAIWLFVDIYGNNGAAFTVSTEIVDVPIEFWVKTMRLRAAASCGSTTAQRPSWM